MLVNTSYFCINDPGCCLSTPCTKSSWERLHTLWSDIREAVPSSTNREPWASISLTGKRISTGHLAPVTVTLNSQVSTLSWAVAAGRQDRRPRGYSRV